MPFDYKFPVPATDANCTYGYAPTFHHKDWVDGQDVVQAQQTPDEDGFNLRFRRIEQDIAQLSINLATAFNCISVLRQQVVEVLGEIKAQFNLPPAKTSKEGKDVKDFKDGKDAKDGKDGKDTKDTKDGKDGKDAKDTKDGKDGKDGKDHKDTKDHKDGKDDKDGKEGRWGAKEKDHETPIRDLRERNDLMSFLWEDSTPVDDAPEGHAFIRPDERPPVGERAIKGAEDN